MLNWLSFPNTLITPAIYHLRFSLVPSPSPYAVLRYARYCILKRGKPCLRGNVECRKNTATVSNSRIEIGNRAENGKNTATARV